MQSPKFRGPKSKFIEKLTFFAIRNNKKLAKFLIEKLKVNPNSISKSGETALTAACFCGNLSMVKCLVECQAEIDQPNRVGSRPIAFAASVGSVPIVRYLLENGANLRTSNSIQVVGNGSVTPLHYASSSGRTEMVKHLVLVQNVDVDVLEKSMRNHQVCELFPGTKSLFKRNTSPQTGQRVTELCWVSLNPKFQKSQKSSLVSCFAVAYSSTK